MNEETPVRFRWNSPFNLNHPAGGALSLFSYPPTEPDPAVTIRQPDTGEVT